jgi:hypothetical protein
LIEKIKCQNKRRPSNIVNLALEKHDIPPSLLSSSSPVVKTCQIVKTSSQARGGFGAQALGATPKFNT